MKSKSEASVGQSAPQRRFYRAAVLAACAVVPAAAQRAGATATSATWITQGFGTWGDAGNWSPSVVPNNNGSTTYAVSIPNTGGPPQVAISAASYTIDTLAVGLSSQLNLQAGGNLSVLVPDTAAGSGMTIQNYGTITIGDSNPNDVASLTLGSGGTGVTTIGASGQVNLGAINDQLNFNGASGTIGANQLVSGAGHVNFSDLTNNGTIRADVTPDQLPPINDPTLSGGGKDEALILAGSTMTNNGTLESTNSAELDLGNNVTALTINNTSTGSIYATLNSTIVLNGVAIAGGTIGNAAIAGTAGTIETAVTTNGFAGPAILDGKTNGVLTIANGTNFLVNDDTTLSLTGEINSSGAYTFAADTSNNDTGRLLIGDGTTGDTVTLSGNSTTILQAISVSNAAEAETLTNAFGHTISGGAISVSSGDNGSGTITGGLVNQGSIRDCSLSGTVTNNGAIYNGSIYTSVANTNGTITAEDGNTLYLNGTITGGTLKTAGSGQIVVPNGGSASFDGTAAGGITTNGAVVLQEGASLGLAGTVTNNGVIQTDAGLTTYTVIAVGSGYGNDTVTLNGSGSLLLTDTKFALVTGLTSTETLVNGAGHTIGGSGEFDTTLKVTNNGIVSVPAGDTLIIDNLNNYNKSSSTLSGGTYNIAGTFKVDPEQITTLDATVTLDGPGAAFLNTDGTNALASLSTIGPDGSLTVEGGKTFTTSSLTFTNLGALTIEPGSAVTLTTFASGGTTGYHIAVDSSSATASPISVTGPAALSGDLDVILDTTLDEPSLLSELDGKTFTVITAGTLTGLYDNTAAGRVEAMDDSGDNVGSFAITYNEGVGDQYVVLSDFNATNVSVPEPATLGIALPWPGCWFAGDAGQFPPGEWF